MVCNMLKEILGVGDICGTSVVLLGKGYIFLIIELLFCPGGSIMLKFCY